MTSSPFDGCGRRDTGIDESNAQTPPNPTRGPTSDPSPLPMLRRTAPASRPSGRCAVGLRPSLDPDAFLGVPGTYGERPKKDQQHPLTGPVPSGMTCDDPGKVLLDLTKSASWAGWPPVEA